MEEAESDTATACWGLRGEDDEVKGGKGGEDKEFNEAVDVITQTGLASSTSAILVVAVEAAVNVVAGEDGVIVVGVVVVVVVVVMSERDWWVRR